MIAELVLQNHQCTDVPGIEFEGNSLSSKRDNFGHRRLRFFLV